METTDHKDLLETKEHADNLDEMVQMVTRVIADQLAIQEARATPE